MLSAMIVARKHKFYVTPFFMKRVEMHEITTWRKESNPRKRHNNHSRKIDSYLKASITTRFPHSSKIGRFF